MQHRLSEIGGSYRIESQPGQGTCVRFSVTTGPHPRQASSPEC